MNDTLRTIKTAVVGMALGMMLSLPPAIYFLTLPTEPYTNVEKISIRKYGDEVRIIASFHKNDDCVFVDIGVFGGILGQWDKVEWRDMDEPQGDRIAGRHTIRMIVSLDKPYQTIEVRTRHDCNGEKVDKIFLKIPID